MRKAYVALLLMLTVLCTAAVFAPSATAKVHTIDELKAMLKHAKSRQKEAVAKAGIATANLEGALLLRGGLTDLALLPELMNDAVPARLLADAIVSDTEIAVLERDLVTKRNAVASWTKKVKGLQERLNLRLQIEKWNRNHTWWPLIKIACAKYDDVNPKSLQRMMILESSGNPRLGGPYQGLFQYSWSTWRSHWNPWRNLSIYDGWAQIRATALAIHKGMGRSQWPNTYCMAF